MKNKALIIVLILLIIPVAMDAQCSMCRAVLQASDDKGPAVGINNGIVYLMVFPYILMGGLGYYLWRSHKKRTKQKSS